MEIRDQEVRFDIYCSKCKYKVLDEKQDPCNECLAMPMNEDTQKPVFFKEA